MTLYFASRIPENEWAHDVREWSIRKMPGRGAASTLHYMEPTDEDGYRTTCGVRIVAKATSKEAASYPVCKKCLALKKKRGL